MELDVEFAAKVARKAGRHALAEAVDKAQIIVIAQRDIDMVSNEKVREMSTGEPGTRVREITREEIFDLLCKVPFPVTYFEPMGVPYVMDGEKLRYAILAEEMSTSPLTFDVHGFMFSEKSAKVIGCRFILEEWGLRAIPYDRHGNLFMNRIPDRDWMEEVMSSLASNFCQMMATYLHRDTRTGTVTERLKDRQGRAQPRELIYLRRVDAELAPNPKLTTKPITWLHSWRVSGCWVRVRGIGKDRSGNYCVKGMTWRVPHIKGKGKLVEKIRVRMQRPGEANTGLEHEMGMDDAEQVQEA